MHRLHLHDVAARGRHGGGADQGGDAGRDAHHRRQPVPLSRHGKSRAHQRLGHRIGGVCARQLGRAPTGNGGGGGAISTGNLTLLPGSASRDALMADIVEGVLVTELIGQGADMLTGDYSRGASGWRIVDGRLAGQVAGFTIAGNLLTMFADLRAASDLDTRHATHVPTLRTDSMTVAGD